MEADCARADSPYTADELIAKYIKAVSKGMLKIFAKIGKSGPATLCSSYGQRQSFQNRSVRARLCSRLILF